MRVILKKANFYCRRVFKMNKLLILLLSIVVFVAAGCRRYNPDELPEVEPLPGEKDPRIKINVNIDENSAKKKTAVKGKEKKQEIQAAPKRRRSGGVILSPKAQKNAKKKQAARKKREIVPSAVGIIDGELNSVEQSYLREVRARREQQLKASEQQVFGSFSPGNIFKAPQE